MGITLINYEVEYTTSFPAIIYFHPLSCAHYMSFNYFQQDPDSKHLVGGC